MPLEKKRRVFFVALVLSVLTWLTACDLQEKKLSGTNQAAVLAFSEAATDNLFAGLTANDYAAFSRDFDIRICKRPYLPPISQPGNRIWTTKSGTTFPA